MVISQEISNIIECKRHIFAVTMNEVLSYESLVHAVSGAVVSGFQFHLLLLSLSH